MYQYEKDRIFKKNFGNVILVATNKSEGKSKISDSDAGARAI